MKDATIGLLGSPAEQQETLKAINAVPGVKSCRQMFPDAPILSNRYRIHIAEVTDDSVIEALNKVQGVEYAQEPAHRGVW